MKISAISNTCVNHNYTKTVQQKNYQSFEGNAGKIIGGVLGTAAGGTAGGLAAGGGSLIGALFVAASGPVGWAIASICTIGGAIAGGALGSKLGEKIDEDNKKPR